MLNNRKIQSALAVLFALLLWQAASMLTDAKILLVSPIEVVKRLFELCFEADFLKIVFASFLRIAAGFFAGAISGALLAILAGRFKLVDIMLRPFVVTIKSVPVASFIIIALIWISSNQLASFISLLMVFPVIYTNVLQGINSADKNMLEMAKVYRMNWKSRFLYIYLPSIKPFLLSASQIALGLAWKSGIAAEVIGIPAGSIGEELYRAKVYFDTGSLFAWTVVIVIVSVLFEKAVMLALREAFRGVEKL